MGLLANEVVEVTTGKFFELVLEGKGGVDERLSGGASTVAGDDINKAFF